jgi:hypothetical protein
MAEIKLTEAEQEFIAEMEIEHGWPGSEWHNFDPDFRQMDIIRLFKRGWFERKGAGRDRAYRWTEAGRAALVRVPEKAAS